MYLYCLYRLYALLFKTEYYLNNCLFIVANLYEEWKLIRIKNIMLIIGTDHALKYFNF